VCQLQAERHNLPGIALSGRGMQEDIERSLAAGFEAHLIKPVSLQQLEMTIDKLRKKRSAQSS